MSNILKELKSLEFRSFHNQMKPEAASSFQLRVRDDEGVTKYFVNVDLIDYSSQPFADRMPSSWLEDFVPEYSVQFENDGGTFDVAFHGKGKKVQEVLNFYNSIFDNLQCEYYD